jgi:DNA-binding transcriptional LysR family regulator
MIELRQLKALLVLSEELHFGRAAQRLGMAQPHLSALIRKVEDAAGTRLFERRPQVAPTAAGTIMIDAARGMIDDLEDNLQRARRTGQGESGTVRIGFASTLMLTPIPKLFGRFREMYPDVELALRELHSGAQWEKLICGSIDLSFTREVRSEPGVACRTIVSEPFVLVLPEGHPLATTPQVTLSNVAPEPLVLFRRGAAPTLYQQILSLFEEQELTVHVVQEAEEWHTVLGLVASGFGFSLAPASIRRLAYSGIVYRDIPSIKASADMFLCWLPSRLPPAAAQLIKLFEAELR